jgi:hypothetical protein
MLSHDTLRHVLDDLGVEASDAPAPQRAEAAS